MSRTTLIAFFPYTDLYAALLVGVGGLADARVVGLVIAVFRHAVAL